MAFKVKESNLYPMPGNHHLLHLGTITSGIREFVVMVAIGGPKRGNCYIEEVVLESKDFGKDVFAHLKFIKEDKLAEDLAAFAEEQSLTDMKKRSEELIDRGRTQWLLGTTDLKK